MLVGKLTGKINISEKMFFGADHHFGHENIMHFCDRPFPSVQAMNREMIEKHNSIVGPNDIYFHLGDVTLGQDAGIYLSQMNGRFFIVPGGHDHRWLEYHDGPLYSKYSQVVILPNLWTLEIQTGGKYPIVIAMCHYAMRVWDRSHYGSYHVYGHSHGKITDPFPNSMDVGVDTNNFYPYMLDEVLNA